VAVRCGDVLQRGGRGAVAADFEALELAEFGETRRTGIGKLRVGETDTFEVRLTPFETGGFLAARPGNQYLGKIAGVGKRSS
jgi:hypothetical protein